MGDHRLTLRVDQLENEIEKRLSTRVVMSPAAKTRSEDGLPVPRQALITSSSPAGSVRLKSSPPSSARGKHGGLGNRGDNQVLAGSAYLIASEAATAAAATAAIAEEAADAVFVESVISVPREPPAPAPAPEPNSWRSSAGMDSTVLRADGAASSSELSDKRHEAKQHAREGALAMARKAAEAFACRGGLEQTGHPSGNVSPSEDE